MCSIARYLFYPWTTEKKSNYFKATSQTDKYEYVPKNK